MRHLLHGELPKTIITWFFLLCILLITAVLRFTRLDWDNYDHYQPDERYIAWVATSIEWPTDWRTAFHPTRSTWNPYYWPAEAASAGIVVPQDEPRRFAYGHFPLYLGVAATKTAEWLGPYLLPWLPPESFLARDVLNGQGRVEFRHNTAVSRLLSATMDIATVWVLFWLARRMYGTAVALLAAGLLAFNVMHIQLAHFFAVDPFVTFFVVTAVYGLVVYLQSRKWRHLLFTAVCIGLAVGSKFSAILLVLPLFLAIFWATTPAANWWWEWQKRLLVSGSLIFLVFALTNPFALLDWSCPIRPIELGLFKVTLTHGPCFVDNMKLQGAMVSGSTDNTFTRQYIGTLPYFYLIEMQLRWGMGPLAGVAAFAGLVWAMGGSVAYGVRRLWVYIQQWQTAVSLPLPVPFHASWIVLAWVVPFFLTTGSFYAKFMRYLQPMTPFLLIYAAAWLLGREVKWWRVVVAGVVLVGTAVYALAFLNMYQLPHPWIAASEWIFHHIPRGNMILVEQWDDALPNSVKLDGVTRHAQEYRRAELTWISYVDAADNETHLMENLQKLAGADYLVVASNRIYGVVPRLPERYPLSSQYNQLLFDGRLGYELVYVNGRFPHLFGFYLKPDTFTWPGLRPPSQVAEYLSTFPGFNGGRADESFLVYDQPLTMIFQNVAHKTADEMRQLFILP